MTGHYLALRVLRDAKNTVRISSIPKIGVHFNYDLPVHEMHPIIYGQFLLLTHSCGYKLKELNFSPRNS
jgi:hypothetical protein